MRIVNRIFGVIVLLLICLPQVAYGQTATFMEPGGDATYDASLYPSTAGTVAADSTHAYTGPRALMLSSTAGNITAVARAPAGTASDTGTRCSLRMYADSLPSTGPDQIIAANDASNLGGMGAIRWNTNGTLEINKGQGTTYLAGSTVLVANKYYRLTYAYTITNTTTFRIQLWLNGVIEADYTATGGATLTRTGSSKVSLGIGAVGANRNIWFDDVYCDNGSTYGDPGDIHVTAKRPFSNGSANGMTGSGTPSGYGTGNARYVNEQPLSQSNFVSVIAAGVTTEEYNIENAAVGDRSIPLPGIVATEGWIVASVLAGTENASLVLNNVTSTAALTTTPTTFFAIGAAYPANAGTDIGIITTNLATTVSLYECGVIVAYKLIGAGFFGF